MKKILIYIFAFSTTLFLHAKSSWEESPKEFHGEKINFLIGNVFPVKQTPPGLPEKEGFRIYEVFFGVRQYEDAWRDSVKQTGMPPKDFDTRVIKFVYVPNVFCENFEKIYKPKEDQIAYVEGPISRFGVPIFVEKVPRMHSGVQAKGILWNFDENWVVILKP